MQKIFKKKPKPIFWRVGCRRADFHHPVKLWAVLVKYYIHAVASNASVKFMRLIWILMQMFGGSDQKQQVRGYFKNNYRYAPSFLLLGGDQCLFFFFFFFKWNLRFSILRVTTKRLQNIVNREPSHERLFSILRNVIVIKKSYVVKF